MIDSYIKAGKIVSDIRREASKMIKEGTLILDLVEFVESEILKNGYTYPVFFDPNATSVEAYGLNSFPTTYMIDDEGYIYGYISGAIPYDTMVEIIKMTQTKDYSVK